jgi:hypothetical protein
LTDPHDAQIATLAETVLGLPRVRVAGSWTRVLRTELLVKTPPGLSSPDPLWAGGTLLASSRYIPKGLCAALHLADSATTGMAEDVRLDAPEASPVFETPAKSITLIPVQVDIREVVDLTDVHVREALGVRRLDELTALDLDYQAVVRAGAGALSLPKRIGSAAVRCGEVVALKVPSARRTAGVNLVIFEDRLRELAAGTLTARHPLTGVVARKP